MAANVFALFSFQIFFPVLPRFIAEVVLNRPPDSVGGQVGLASGLVALVAVCTRVPAGQLADRFGRRRFMFVGATFFVLAPLIHAASRGMALLFLGRAVHGLGLAMFTTSFQALIADLAPPERRGEALGLAGASSSISFICAPLAGDWLASSLGYTPFFALSAAAGLVCLTLVTRIAAPPARVVEVESELDGLAGLRLALRKKEIHAGALTMAALGVPFGVLVTFLALLADEKGVAGVGAVYSIYAISVLLFQPLSGWLSDRVGRRGVMLPGLACVALATGVLYHASSLPMFILGGVVFGMGFGLTRGGVDALVQDSIPPTLRGTAAAVQYTSFDFWIGASSYPAGLLADAAGYAATFVASGALCLAGGAALSLLLRGSRQLGSGEVGSRARLTPPEF
jgi:MFS family permease